MHGILADVKETNDSLNQQAADDDQFDAETRSFDGLFEDYDDEGGSAALEEVDDFDESEATMAHSHIIHPDDKEQQEDDDPSDDGEENFTVGPSHLEFVTLPTTIQKHHDSHHLANV